MCNNMGFLENLLSGDFGGHFSILSLYFILLSPDEIGLTSELRRFHLFYIESFILQFDFKITLTSYQASAGRDDVRGRELRRP